jgi:cobalt-zinc-cadmium efflux system membrane fusion protein
MKSQGPKIGFLLILIPSLLLLGGCKSAHGDPRAAGPPPATVVADTDVSLFSVEHPEQFPLTAAVGYSAAPKLVVTGTVNPDISRNVPVISLATGRVVVIHARLTPLRRGRYC